MELNITWNDVPWTTYRTHFTGDQPDEMIPGWVVTHEGSALEVVTQNGTVVAEISGRLRYLSELGTGELPAVGDFVSLRPGDPAQIDAVLPRRTAFRRKEAGQRTEAQIICANADLAVIVTTAPALGVERVADVVATDTAAAHDLDDFSLRRIERYIATLDPQIRPVVVLNKCDLIEDPQAVQSYVAAELPGAVVVALSALTGDGVNVLTQLIEKGQTAVMVGSSGCGKSTLIAQLTGTDLKTGAVRTSDGRGRHTTTSRRMYRLPEGGILVDTPGMREVQLWADDDTGTDAIAAAFPEITELEGGCRFRDCKHEHEPGCAIKQAIAEGTVLAERYQSYLQLRDEIETTAEMRRQRSREWGKQISKLSRQLKKARNG
ncbi:MAG: ribosome small subunit-dependent GTPase A [Spirochaetales bacterium]|nr:ribosome small subunit-dependent GTPase A [Spirochaetales bacterium]